ncbi:Homoserine O-succinyltransferase [Dermatophilus congolensis]|uniref:Homoserine O-acetyltransferase n=1 Tax=Dermatophilus congolensis TaxID=1863 RepID=A0A239V2T6_9MICO|nr:homoserine O-succinyltransferase [Dermatophilus congolensis]SNV16412.1 Homoserine O-succinyltransferase [Dermatophilus congolensis]
MPVNIPHSLPARRVLEAENVFVMSQERAARQDIRPLRIAILNLMPLKIDTETHLLRLLGNTPLQVEISLLNMSSHHTRNTPPEHMRAFYRTFTQVKDEWFDGLIITGAPVEKMPFEAVDYWGELTEVLAWSKESVYSTLNICWGAQAALYVDYGIPKYDLPEKMFGVFQHRVVKPTSPLLSGFDEYFPAPHSRHTATRTDDVALVDELEILAESDEAGLYLAGRKDGRAFYVTGHPEYERDTLRGEWERDRARGLSIRPPHGYFPGDDPTRDPIVSWRAHAFLLYANWLNHCVYQGTPYEAPAFPVGGLGVR